MKKLILLLLLSLSAMAQDVYIPIGNTRQLTKIRTVIVAPGVLAEMDAAKGDAAFADCTKLNPSAGMLCETQRSSAEVTDAQERFKTAFKVLYTNSTNADQTLAASKLYFAP